jgi:Phytanoyl-CoA dioxygenase (PhyH)
MNLPDHFRKDFEQKGYAIVKAVFTPAEIDELRRLVLLSEQELSAFKSLQSASKTPAASAPAIYSSKEDLLANPYLRHLVSDDRILTIVRTLLGSEDIVYMSEGSWTIHRNTHTTPMMFHKDNPDRINGNSPDWMGPYHILRLGIYLQDHSQHSGGLSVFEGSHSSNSVKDGKVVTEWGKRVYLRTQPGDVAIWYLKTSHAGDWGIPRIGLLNVLPVKVLRKLHRLEFLFKDHHAVRAALFLSYGVDSSSTERYKQYLRTRKWSFDKARGSAFDPSLAKKLKAEKRLDIFNIKEVMQGVKPEEVSEQHRDLPF